MIDTAQELEYVGRIAGAVVLGGAIGLERELHGQSAGLRTHMIVAVGSALMMIVSIRMGDAYNSDRARIAAQVVTGIGFLGAGAIVRSGLNVRGLTTAACIWTAAGIGLAIGSGWYIGAAAGTAVTLIAIYGFNLVEQRFVGGKHMKQMTVKIRDEPGAIGRVEDFLERRECHVKEIGINKDLPNRRVTLSILAACPEKCDFETLSRELAAIPEVEGLDIE